MDEAWDELTVGVRVADRYEVVGPSIGRGASGVVYPALDDAGLPVALKLLHPHVVSDAEAFRRLQREVGRASSLKHPHVLGVQGLVAHARRTVLVTERVEGGSVSELSGPLPVDAVVAIGLQLCSALAAAHAAGLVHGDVRAGNVLLGPAGLRLFDFGVADVAPVQLRPGETPPEVLDGAPPTRRSDLYGLGLVLARAALGHEPFRGGTPWGRVGAQRSGAPFIDGLPLGLQAILKSLLHPDPLLRPASALEVRRALVGLSRRPERAVILRHRGLPAVGVRRTWAVHGIDPGTGAACVFATRLGGREARRLARRLDEEGWVARAEPVALGWRDGAWVAGLAAIGAVVLPVLGAVIVGAMVLRWRIGRVRSELPAVLPSCTVPLPPVRPSGVEQLVMAGVLLLLAGGLGAFSGWLALLPALGGAALLFRISQGAMEPARAARRARIQVGFQALHRQLEARAPYHLLEQRLSEAGDLDAMESAWRQGEVADEAVIGWLDDRVRRAHVEAEGS